MLEWILVIIAAAVLLYLIYEMKLRTPDQIILYEAQGHIKQSTSTFYPRHFRLAIPRTVHSMAMDIKAEAKGKILVEVSLSVTAAASTEHLDELIRVGGWKKDAVHTALKEFDGLLQSVVKEYTEKHEVEDITLEAATKYLREKIGNEVTNLGLAIVSLSVQAIEPVDEKIGEALRQKESARIMEQTERASQEARVAASRVKLQADQEIAKSEHTLSLQKYELRKKEEAEESALAQTRVEEELKRRKLQLDMEKEELAMLKDSPELLMLTPQAARLAEASQQLRNARTIVSLSPQDLAQGSNLLGMLQEYLQGMAQSKAASQTSEK